MSRNFVVVGGGWSVSRFPAEVEVPLSAMTLHAHVIGVNDVAIHTKVHEALTMDRLWFENRWPLLRTSSVDSIWVREKCDCNVPRTTGLDRWGVFRHFNRDYPSEESGVLHGGNSGTCAINLAFQQMAAGDTLYLLGFDMCKGPKGEPYWYSSYHWAQPEGATKPGYFNKWVKDLNGFAKYAAARKLRVYNASKRSRIELWPKISFVDMWGKLS